MNISFAPITNTDREPIIDIFNYYIENSYAAYPEHPLPYAAFDHLLNACQGYPTITARDEKGQVIGFGMLRPYNPMPAFAQTAEITYFLKPDITGKGIGKRILDQLIAQAKGQGITSILASISALNEGSIHFHLKNGFTQCGRFNGIGIKKGQRFDVVYCQRIL